MDMEREAEVGMFIRRSSEKVLAASTLALGLGLAWSPQSLSIGNAFAFMRVLAPVQFWVFYLALLGGVRIAFLIVNGKYPQSHEVRTGLSALTLFTVWTPVGGNFMLVVFLFALDGQARQFYPSAVLGPAMVIFEGLAFFALATIWRWKADARRLAGEAADRRAGDVERDSSGLAGE